MSPRRAQASSTGRRADPVAVPTVSGRTRHIAFAGRPGQTVLVMGNRIGYAIVLVVLAGYFVWILLEMAGHIAGHRGDTRLAHLAIGLGLVVVALVASFLPGKKHG
jgi:hypothetical protein